MSLDLTDKSTLVQVMAWCSQATSHYLSQCWPSFLSPYGVTRPHCVNNSGLKMCTGMCLETGACFLSLARSKLRLCSANHRAGYFSNLACDWLSIVWAYSEQETENGPGSFYQSHSNSSPRTIVLSAGCARNTHVYGRPASFVLMVNTTIASSPSFLRTS